MRSQTAEELKVRQFLTFSVAEEEYAIDITRVREILALVPLTRVPRAPAFVRGVINLRGTVVPAMDLRIKLGLGPTPLTARTCLIITDVSGGEGASSVMAVLTEDVRQVVDFTEDNIEPPPAFGTKIDLSFLQGMGDLGDHFALVLDSDKVLTTMELIAAQAAVREATESSPAAADSEKAPKPSKRRREKR